MSLFRRPELFAARASLCLTTAALSLCLPRLRAQTLADGALHGEAVPGTEVAVQNQSTGDRTSTTAGPSGSFLFPQLSPGAYAVDIFPFRDRKSVSIALGQTSELTRRNPDEPESSFTTPGANPDQDGDGLFSFRGLASTQTRTLIDGLSGGQSFGAVPVGAATGPADDTNDDDTTPEGLGRSRPHGAPYSFSAAAIRGTRIAGQDYSALTGHGAGGIVATASKSGSAVFHGSAFYEIRTSALAAANPFAIATTYANGVVTSTKVKPNDLRQVYGGTLGGPIPYVPKLMFFYTFDQQHRSDPAISSPAYAGFYTLTPTQTALLGNRGVTTTATNSALDYLSSLTGTLLRRADQTIDFLRLDTHPIHHQTISLSWNRVRWNSPAGLTSAPVVARGRASFGDSTGSLDTILLALKTALSPHLSNELRLQYVRDLQFQRPQPSLPQEPGIGPGGQSPEVNIDPNGLLFGTPNTLTRSAYPAERRLQVADSFALVRGRHLLQIGVDFSQVHDSVSSLPNPAGTFSYDSGITSGHAGGLVDWITDYTFNVDTYPNGGCPSITATVHDFCFRSFTQSFGPQTVAFDTQEWAAFAQETWRLGPKVTLNVGGRYEYQLLPLPQQPNAALDLDFSATGASSVFPEDRNNVGPRFGLAFEPIGAGRLTVHLGYGAYFGRLPGATIANALTHTALASSTTSIRITPTTETACPQVANSGSNQGFGYACAYLSAPPAAVAATTTATVFDRHFRLPTIQQASLTLERDLSRRTTITLGYTMNLDRQLPGSTDLNITPSPASALFQLQGGTGAPGVRDGETFVLPLYTSRVDPSFGPVTDIVSHVDGTYNALTATLETHPVRSLGLHAGYTWSKSIDYGQTAGATPRTDTQLDPFDLRYDRALSDLNYPHAFTASGVWQPAFPLRRKRYQELTNGWLIAPLLAARSGRPYSLNLFGGTRLAGGNESINGSGGAVYLPTIGRNTMRLPATVHLDLRVSRDLPLWRKTHERVHLRAYAEAFNLTNHTNITSVSQRAYLPGPQITTGVTPLIFQTAAAIATEGLNTQPFATPIASGTSLARERQIQLGLHLDF